MNAPNTAMRGPLQAECQRQGRENVAVFRKESCEVRERCELMPGSAGFSARLRKAGSAGMAWTARKGRQASDVGSRWV